MLRYGAPAISVAILGAALFAMRGIDYRSVIALLPARPLFWLVLALTYCAPILTDWLIYHRIWRLPLPGIVPLTRKLIGNEIIVGYIGDAYLFAWARQRQLVSRGAISEIKDVAILSAGASNIATILFALAAAPFAGMLGFHLPIWVVVIGAGVILAPAIVAVTLRRAIFVLPGRDLLAIMAVHAVRAIATPLLLALLWHLALPAIALKWWIVFTAIRQVLSRLPFMSNKDLILAGVAAILFGRQTDVATALAMIATVITLCHVTVGIALSFADVAIGTLGHWQKAAIGER